MLIPKHEWVIGRYMNMGFHTNDSIKKHPVYSIVSLPQRHWQTAHNYGVWFPENLEPSTERIRSLFSVHIHTTAFSQHKRNMKWFSPSLCASLFLVVVQRVLY